MKTVFTKEEGNLIDNYFSKMKKENEAKKEDDYGDSNLSELRNQYVYMLVDSTGSMRENEEPMANACMDTLQGLKEKSEDYNSLTKLVSWGESIYEVNSNFMDPGELLEIVKAKYKLKEESKESNPFYCYGKTNISMIVDYIDSQLSRSSELCRNIKKGDPKILFLIITDYEDNNSLNKLRMSVEHLYENRFFTQYCKILVIYCGEERNKAAAEKLAGGPENLIALNDAADIDKHLAAITVNSIVNLIDPTHIKNRSHAYEETPNEVAQRQHKRAMENEKSVENLTDEEATAELERALGLMKG